MISLDIKPLSVNEAWQGKRYKTKSYKNYSTFLLSILPKMNLPQPPYKVTYHFYFTNKASDIDNPVKPLQDILCKKYGFDDKDIYEICIKKYIANEPKIEFTVETLLRKS